MFYLLIIIAFDLANVICHLIQIISTLFPFLTLIYLSYIDSGRRNGSFLLLLIALVLFYLLAGFLGGLGLLLLLLKSSFLGPSSKFFSFKFFSWLNFSRNDMHRLVASLVMLINVAVYRGLHLGFCFNFNNHLNQNVSSISFPAFFIN